jgi:putative membrane protein
MEKSGHVSCALNSDQTPEGVLRHCRREDIAMHTLQNHSGKREFVIAQLMLALLVLVFAGCGTSNNQPAAASSVAATTPLEAASPPSATAPANKRSTAHAPASAGSNIPNTGLILAQMHETNLMEIAIGKIAAQKASSSEVRAYADQLVQDHSNVDRMVVAAAQDSGTNLKNGAEAHQAVRHETAREKELERKLKTAQGADFDRLFLKETSADHDKLISKLQQDKQNTSDEELETLIEKVIPVLEQHRELAQILMKKEQA